jgi:hypothetical protein
MLCIRFFHFSGENDEPLQFVLCQRFTIQSTTTSVSIPYISIYKYIMLSAEEKKQRTDRFLQATTGGFSAACFHPACHLRNTRKACKKYVSGHRDFCEACNCYVAWHLADVLEKEAYLSLLTELGLLPSAPVIVTPEESQEGPA